MSEVLDTRKWCAIFKLEGYATSDGAQALVHKFNEIVEGFQGAGVDLDVFVFMEDEKDPSAEEPVLGKRNRRSDS